MTWWKKKRALKVLVGACSDVGRVRTENQDAYGCFPERISEGARDWLFVVADGMGGHVGGREASRMAVEAVQERYFSTLDLPAKKRLRSAFETANALIFSKAAGLQAIHRMGTTCTALALVKDRVHLAHVGDSRAYRITERGIEQLTRDHTVAEAMHREGVLTSEEARHHPRRHVLVQAMGMNAAMIPDVLDASPARPGDLYLLCSDGLASLPAEEVLQVVRAHAPQPACEHLVALANERDGRDNATALVVSIA